MSRRSFVLGTAILAVSVFASGAILYNGRGPRPSPAGAAESEALVRPHSPVIGPVGAPVTVVEFFDPSCEACRAFYPIMKRIMSVFPNEVRLVIRYTPLHEGSDVVVRILEAARAQGKFEPVLEALLAGQPDWAVHGAPDLEKAWSIAASAGLDARRARSDAYSSTVDQVIEQDLTDVKANKVRQTPTFFVNGKALPDFGAQQLFDLISQEAELVRKRS